MKKDKEWLKEAVGELNLVDTVFEADGVSYIDTAVSVTQVYDLIDQLDEPKKVVVPKFVAEWYENEKEDLECGIYSLISAVNRKHQVNHSQIEDWANYGTTNKAAETLIKMKLFGYEIEKEKLYYVLDKNNHTMLYRSFDYSITQSKSNYAVDPTRKNFNLNEYQLTEKEIRNYDARFMAFAVEVEG